MLVIKGCVHVSGTDNTQASTICAQYHYVRLLFVSIRTAMPNPSFHFALLSYIRFSRSTSTASQHLAENALILDISEASPTRAKSLTLSFHLHCTGKHASNIHFNVQSSPAMLSSLFSWL